MATSDVRRPLHQYRATCARCRAVAKVEIHGVSEAFDRLRALGWRLVATEGWVCQACIRQEEAL